MKKIKQQSFFKTQTLSSKKFFGGALLNGKRKPVRPLSSKDSIHFVLRSYWALGKDSFLVTRNRKVIDHIMAHFAKKFGVKIYQRAINSNHIHLLLKITNRHLYRAFIKAVSGKIASHVMGQQSFKCFSQSRTSGSKQLTARISERGDGVLECRNHQGFWEFRPFSRVVSWGRDFKACTQYLRQNVLEALGFMPYKTRKNYYTQWLKNTTPDLNANLNITSNLNVKNTS